MKKATAGILIASGICIVGGGVLAVAGVASGGKPGIRITAEGIETAEDAVEMKQSAKKIGQAKKLVLHVQNADVYITRGKKFCAKFIYNEKRSLVSLEEKNGTAEITADYGQETSGVSMMIGIEEDVTESVEITVPEGQVLDAVEIDGAGSQVTVSDIDVSGITMENDSCEVLFKNIRMKSAEVSDFGAGELTCSDSETDSLVTKLDYGTVRLEDCSIGQWDLQMQGGVAEGRDLKIGWADLGNECGTLDLCDIECTGIKAETKDGTVRLDFLDALETYHIKLQTERGSVFADGKDLLEEEKPDDSGKRPYKVEQNPGAARSIEVKSENGSIELYGRER